ncbi:MAG: hypothetical protein DMG39_26015 [Acidobacteria bacterium]|nr:MAG: hypothetical protein DMG39_26015 [Acidobacteriota bacterium]
MPIALGRLEQRRNALYQRLQVVATENPIRSENTEVLIIREIMVATTMSSLFVALFALLGACRE